MAEVTREQIIKNLNLRASFYGEDGVEQIVSAVLDDSVVFAGQGKNQNLVHVIAGASKAARQPNAVCGVWVSNKKRAPLATEKVCSKCTRGGTSFTRTNQPRECLSCGKMFADNATRDNTEQTCGACYEIAGRINAHSDGYHSQERDEDCPECQEEAVQEVPATEAPEAVQPRDEARAVETGDVHGLRGESLDAVEAGESRGVEGSREAVGDGASSGETAARSAVSAPDAVSAVRAHDDGDHDHAAVEGCPTCVTQAIQHAEGEHDARKSTECIACMEEEAPSAEDFQVAMHATGEHQGKLVSDCPSCRETLDGVTVPDGLPPVQTQEQMRASIRVERAEEQVRERIEDIATRLRRMADDVEREGRYLTAVWTEQYIEPDGVPMYGTTDRAAQIVNDLAWMTANMGAHKLIQEAAHLQDAVRVRKAVQS